MKLSAHVANKFYLIRSLEISGSWEVFPSVKRGLEPLGKNENKKNNVKYIFLKHYNSEKTVWVLRKKSEHRILTLISK